MQPFLDPELRAINQQIVNCRLCPRLVAYRETVGLIRRKAYKEQIYWSRPVPGFGDPNARLFIIGLAPGAHGANRTGRIFTGDRSGEFLYRALFETGFANQPHSISADDGLVLNDAYISCPVRCVPPDNKPTPLEMDTCRTYLADELLKLSNIQVILALGSIALNSYLRVLQERHLILSRSAFRFGHGQRFQTHANGPVLLASYHPSQQNTSTGRLTGSMLREIFEQARAALR